MWELSRVSQLTLIIINFTKIIWFQLKLQNKISLNKKFIKNDKERIQKAM